MSENRESKFEFEHMSDARPEKIIPAPEGEDHYLVESRLASLNKIEKFKEDYKKRELEAIREEINNTHNIKNVPSNYNIETPNSTWQIQEVKKEKIYPKFGNHDTSSHLIEIREDLPPRIKKFVRAHEIYHSKDSATWGGWLGREIRANIVPRLEDPLGLLLTIKASLTKERLKHYWQRYKNKI